jgi:hypothetical protein
MGPLLVGQLVPTLAILKDLESELLTAFLLVDLMAAHLGDLLVVMKDLPLVDPLADLMVVLSAYLTVVLSAYLTVVLSVYLTV